MNDHIPRSAAELAEMIADKEMLSGASRARFVACIAKVTNEALTLFFERRDRIDMIIRCLVAPTPLVTALCYFSVFRSMPTLGAVAIAINVAAVSCFFFLSWRRKKVTRNIEFLPFSVEWNHYCQSVRPIIILREPGLLDRNLFPEETPQ